MEYFAITPDDIRPAELIERLPGLRDRQVSRLYLRARPLHGELERLIPLVRQHAIIPIIPRKLYEPAYGAACAVHTRSGERFDAGHTPSGVAQTASCHSAEDACALLDSGAGYVFISPVYRPVSKLGDLRPLIAPDALRMLALRYGPRIVLLGGLTPQRIHDLHTALQADFSAAGISMFFT